MTFTAALRLTLPAIRPKSLFAGPRMSQSACPRFQLRFFHSGLTRLSDIAVSRSGKPLIRYSSHLSPVHRPAPRRKVTIQTLQLLYQRGEPITMLTAHDHPSGRVADASGMEMILVGDSLGMVGLGLEDTGEVTMEQMLLHCQSVARAAQSSFIVGDLPMGSFEVSPEQAVASALRIIKEGRAHGVKLEGDSALVPAIRRLTQAGIPVVGHVGLTPQRRHLLGGFKVQGKSADSALRLLHDAIAMQNAGAFMVVLEAIPAEVASIITQRLRVPTIGIGAGNGCSGQVLVQADMTGNFEPGQRMPKFVKQYADLWREVEGGITRFRDEVKNGLFPSQDFTYPIAQEELAEFKRAVREA